MTLCISIERKTFDAAPAGSDATFVEFASPGMLGGDLAIKVFKSKPHAVRARERQHRLYLRRAAPAVGPIVLVRVYKKRKVDVHYGYITEVASRHRDATEAELAWLEGQMMKADLNVHDIGPGNVGFIDNRVVFLDFGDASV